MSTPSTTLSPYERALLDCWNGEWHHPLFVESSLGDRDEMPVDMFFREEDEMTDLELAALEHCRGTILDVGAGAGCHSLVLQTRRKSVEALEISRSCVEIMLLQGVENVYHDDIHTFNAAKFDTILLLMNGIGLAGTLHQLPSFLQKLKSLLVSGGQILIDSSDIAYAYENQPLPTAYYYGELRYRYTYQQQQGDWFPWLYADQVVLKRIALENGLQSHVLYEDEFGQFLCRLTPC